MAAVTFACPTCHQPISAPVVPLPTGLAPDPRDGAPLIPRGYFLEPVGEYFAQDAASVAIAVEDLRGTRPHPDRRRHNGCCGPDGCDGPNLVCAAGHEIGTQKGDCWMPHAVVLLPGIVRR